MVYRAVVAQARRPEFFAAMGVPDTLDGRFELICLHAFLFLRRLKGESPPASAFGQRFFDVMFADFDRSLREIGTGDLSVGRQVKRMAEAFYGRIRAYEEGLAADDAALAAGLARNLYGTATATPVQIERIVAYLRREATNLASQPTAALLAGRVGFDPP
jgi:cytochrome b pre-mRNA-processing protein 3